VVNFVQADISKTNYTATIVQSSNVNYEQDNDYMLWLALVIVKPIPDDCNFLYFKTAICAIQVLNFVLCHTSIKFCIVVPKCAIQELNFVLWCLNVPYKY
jgi:hypothetical protein